MRDNRFVPLLRPFDFLEEEKRRRRYSHDEQKDLIREYVQLRTLLDDPLASMHAKVLQPMCENCLYPSSNEDSPIISSFVPLYPERKHVYLYPSVVKPERTYFASYGMMFFRREPKWEIPCYLCQQDMEDRAMFHVVEESFQRYFCLEDESKGLKRWLREHILEVYGQKCFQCGKALSLETLTIDHIRPKSKGGDDRPTNLQPMCADCNNRLKGDADVRDCYVCLDCLARRPPSDSYSDLIW